MLKQGLATVLAIPLLMAWGVFGIAFTPFVLILLYWLETILL